MKRWLSALLIMAMLCAACPSGVAGATEEIDAELVPIDGMAWEESCDAVLFEGVQSEEDAQSGEEDSDSQEDSLIAPEEIESFSLVDEAFLQAPQSEETAVDTGEAPLWPAYACAKASDTIVYADERCDFAWTALRGGDTVLILAQEDGFAKVVFDTRQGIAEGYVDSGSLALLTQSEAEALQDDLALSGEAAIYGDACLLLPRLELSTPQEDDDPGVAFDLAEDPDSRWIPDVEYEEGLPAEEAAETEIEIVDDPEEEPAAEDGKPTWSVAQTQDEEEQISQNEGADEPTQQGSTLTEPDSGANAEGSPEFPIDPQSAEQDAQDPSDGKADGAEQAEEGQAAQEEDAAGAEDTADAQQAAEPALAAGAAADNGTEPVPTPSPVATGVRLSATSLSIGLKENYAGLKATVLPEGATTSLTWKSSKPKIVKVNATTGKLTGLKKGKATITVRTANGRTASCKVTVKKAPGSIRVSPSSVNMWVGGGAYQLARPKVSSGAASGAFSYASGNPAVAKVSASGLITPVAKGSTFVAAKSYNGKTATVRVNVYKEPVRVQFNVPELRIHVGQRVSLGAKALDGDGAAVPAGILYAISPTLDAGMAASCVQLSATGTLVGMQEGSVRICAASRNGTVSDVDLLIRVLPAPDSITLNRSSLSIGVKETFAGLRYTIGRTDGTESAATVSWRSSNPKVVRVNAGTGAVTGVKKGTATITATTHNGRTASCRVTVKAAPKKVTLAQASATLYAIGETVQIHAGVNGGAASALRYSGGGSVASVDASGKVTALRSGSTSITVKAYNGKSASFRVNVIAPVTKVALPGSYVIAEQQRFAATAIAYDQTGAVTRARLTWEVVSGSDKLQIDGKGQMLGLDDGAATLRVRAVSLRNDDGSEKTATCPVTVVKAPRSIVLSNNRTSIGVGETIHLGPTLLDEDGNAVNGAFKVTVNKPKTASASSSGTIKGKKKGSVKVTIRAYNGVTLTRTISVRKKPAKLTLTPKKSVLGIGQSSQLKAAFNSGATGAIAFHSSNPAVATVDANGRITGIRPGTAQITAQSYVKKVKASVTVTVSAGQPEYIRLTGNGVSSALSHLGDGRYTTAYRATVYTGSILELQPKVEYPANGQITEATTSDASVATVNTAGHVTGLKPGTATIVFTATGGAQVTCTVYVVDRMASEDDVIIGDPDSGSGSGTKPPTALALSPAEYQAELGTGGLQLTATFGAPDESDKVIYQSNNAGVATVNGLGYVTFMKAGQVTITARTSNGKQASARITVLPDPLNYRLYAAVGYAMNGYKGAGRLPFPVNNLNGLRKVFGNSGMNYTLVQALTNPTAATVLSSLRSYAEGARSDNDVSLIYLCSHGHSDMQLASGKQNRNYRMSFPEVQGGKVVYGALSSAQIFSAISAGRGRVILILDSCYSGAFIEDVKSSLDAAGGRISVLTASNNTTATYYNVADTSKAVDFFTLFMLLGTGYDCRNHYYIKDASNAKGVAPGYMLADSTSNPSAKDGVITLAELYDYASKCIAANIPGYSGKSWFWGNSSVTTRCYFGGNANLPVYRPNA